jgi:hypothetical protein
MLEIIFFVLVTLVLPVVIERTTEGRFKWIKVYERQIWTAIFAFLSLYLLNRPEAVEVAVKLHNYIARPWLGYVLAGVLGGLLLCCYWWFTGLVAAQTPVHSSQDLHALQQTKQEEPHPKQREGMRPAASVPNPARPKAQGPSAKPQSDTPPAAVISVQTDALSLIKRYSESVAEAYSQKRSWIDPTRNLDRASIPFHIQGVDKEFNQKYRKFYESEVLKVEGELLGQIKQVPPVPTGFPERDRLYLLRSDSVVSPENSEGQILDICSLLSQMQRENSLPITCSEEDLKYKFHPDQYPNRAKQQ